MNNPLSEFTLLKLDQIIGNPDADPPITPILPISRASWYQGISEGRYPKPLKIGLRSVAWRRSDIIDLLKEISI